MAEFRAYQRNKAIDGLPFPQHSETVSVPLLMPAERQNDEHGVRIR
jgi:hypothetical protein